MLVDRNAAEEAFGQLQGVMKPARNVFEHADRFAGYLRADPVSGQDKNV